LSVCFFPHDLSFSRRFHSHRAAPRTFVTTHTRKRVYWIVCYVYVVVYKHLSTSISVCMLGLWLRLRPLPVRFGYETLLVLV
jgi:hypothetical protein